MRRFLKRFPFYKVFVCLFISLYTLLPSVQAVGIVAEDYASEDVTVETEIDTSEDILDEGISDPEWIANPEVLEEVPEEVEEPLFVYEDGVYTVHSVLEGEEYVYPDNDNVRIEFTSITEEGNLVISRVTLTQEQKEELNTSDDYGWDISSTMSNGSFTYDLTLPNTLGNDVEVKYTEDDIEYKTLDDVIVNENVIEIEGLDHFSIYIVSSILPVKPSPAPVQVETKVSCDITVPTDVESIQEAINKSGESGKRLTICVKEGVYRGENLIIDHPVRLVALLDYPQTKEAVIIGKETGDPTIHIKGAQGVGINGLTIVENESEKGGILVEDSSECSFINNRFLDNRLGMNLINGEKNTIEKNIFENNQKHITIKPLDNDMLLKTILSQNKFDGSIIVRSQTRSSSTIIPTIFGTIQAAVDSANDNDTLDIYDGSYEENVNIDAPLSLKGVQNGPVIKGGFAVDTVGSVNVNNLEFRVPTGEPIDSIHINNVDELYVMNSNFDGSGLFVGGGIKGIMSGDSDAKVTVQNSNFNNGYDTAIQGRYEQLDIDKTNISNCKSGINFQGGGNLVAKYTNISVIAQGEDNDPYAVRFASSSVGSGQNMILGGGKYSVDKNGFTADLKTYHSAIVVRSGASGDLKANNLSLDGDVVNLSDKTLDATNNWWGDLSGPYHPTDNLTGQGNSVSNNVEFCPWLDAEDGNPVGPCLGEIQGKKYEDSNQNTWMNNGEPGIKDWNIILYDYSWNPLKSMLTGDDSAVRGNVADDQFRFEDLQPGTYYVCEARDLSYYQTGPTIGDNPKTNSGSIAHTDAVAVANESPNSISEGESCWQVKVTGDDLVGYIQFGNIGLDNPESPTQTGYEDINGKTFNCTGGYTAATRVKILWTDKSIGTTPPDNLLKYQRQYSRNGNNWSGNEIYTNNYTDFKSFGYREVTHYSRVRSFYDTNMNGIYDTGEPVSDWSDTCGITYDATPPEPPILAGDPVQYINWGDVTRSWLPSASTDVDYYIYENITNGWTSGPYDAGKSEYNITHPTGNDDRIFEWKVLAVDYAGNETWSEDTYKVVVDETKPTVEITNVEITDKKLSFTVSGEDNLSGAKTVATNIYDEDNSGATVIGIGRLAHDITPETLTVSYDATDIDVSGLESGIYTIRAFIRDYSGNFQYTTYKIEIDNTPPVLSQLDDITLVQGSSITPHIVEITEEVGLEKICLNDPIENAEVCDESIDPNIEAWDLMGFIADEMNIDTVDTTKLEIGVHTLEYYAIDLAGNISNIMSVTITVEENPPFVLIEGPTSAVVLKELVTLTASISEGTGTPEFEFLWGGDCSGTEQTIIFTQASAGSYTCTVLVTDAYGNTSTDTFVIAVAGNILGAQHRTTRDTTTTSTPLLAQSPLGTGGYLYAQTTNGEEETEEETDDTEVEDTEDVEKEKDTNVKGTEDENDVEEEQEGRPWWVYPLIILPLILLFIILFKRRKEDEEPQY